MKILRNINDLKKAINKLPNLGFVPTMGGLHKGHISLIRESKKKCNKTLVSIYVNPKQFNNFKDYKNYPRKLNRDIEILRKLSINFLFLPKTRDIYREKKLKKTLLKKKEKILCAKFRKDHFEGVLDVMDRLINLIIPKYIFLGEKDFQQLFLINKYLGKKYKIKIYPCKTIRDKNFLALSTRNFLLSKNELKIASYIAKVLSLYKKQVLNNKKIINKTLNIKKMLIKKFRIKIDYLEFRNEKDLKLYNKNKKFRLFVAYHINKIRLIDNF